ncbi:hypothetical protein [Streptomyces akebiae]|uniref:Secreted protein n=1 Tax=Streptomyces akebiae TaxID=2865673 RepID=A0ABX8XLQ7_9ACTN|nr:hypothetical protein [Streptomyces akebiae]QYX76518.1 hypothetical protein K1J60_08380 [Streptomyces akebiae]
MSWVEPVVVIVVLAALRLGGEVVRWLRAKAKDEARAAMLVGILRECGPGAVLTERSGEAALTVRSGGTPTAGLPEEGSSRG